MKWWRIVAVLCAGCGADPVEPSGCRDGDTRECVGAGACTGGQSCVDAEWSQCDCGPSTLEEEASHEDDQLPIAAGGGGSTIQGSLLDDCNADGMGGPVMIRREMPDGRAYCIDTSEVSVSHYSEFLGSGPDVLSQITECTSNASFEGACSPERSDVSDEPMVCVDWCDALAYCTWAGKRLCQMTPARVPDLSEPQGVAIEAFFGTKLAERDEWHNACSRGGTSRFAYGDEYAGDQCNLGPVQQPGCADTTGELFGLSGNVAEWIAPCWGTSCFTRSELVNEFNLSEDAFNNGFETGLCDLYETHGEDRLHPRIGFRCCRETLN